MTATRISHFPRARRLFVQRQHVGSVWVPNRIIYMMDTPVASPPIATEPMHSNESSPSAIPAIADRPTGHRRSVGQPAQAISFRCMPTQFAALLSSCTGLRSIIDYGLLPPADPSNRRVSLVTVSAASIEAAL